MQNQENEDLGIKLGSDDMVFWRDLIESKKIDLKTTEQNLKFYKFIIEYAEIEYKKAEASYENEMKEKKK